MIDAKTTAELKEPLARLMKYLAPSLSDAELDLLAEGVALLMQGRDIVSQLSRPKPDEGRWKRFYIRALANDFILREDVDKSVAVKAAVNSSVFHMLSDEERDAIVDEVLTEISLIENQVEHRFTHGT